MKTTLFLLSLLLLSLPVKAQGGGTDPGTPPEMTFWHDQLTDVSVGNNSTSDSDDVLLSVTNTDTTYTVKTAKGLAWIAKVTNDSLFYKTDDTDNTANYPHRAGFEGCTVKLDFTGDSLSLRAHYWTPIGDATSKPFKGAFDGNHKLVAGLKVDTVTAQYTSAYVGLFGYIVNASVSDVGVWVATKGVKGNSSFFCFAGGIAGSSKGSTIRNCFVSGDAGATITGIGPCCVGGIVGSNYGTVENCYVTVDVSASGSSIYAGGIAGYNDSSITSVYATGKVTGTATSICDVGGISGSNSGTLSKALALNKDGLSGSTSGTNGRLYLGRISGDKGAYSSSFLQCFASTKIDISSYKDTRKDTYTDGTDAGLTTDLSLLFPTGSNAVWTSGSTGSTPDNLPQLSSFSAADASNGNPGQPAIAKADYLEELPLGTEGNPYVIDLSLASSENVGKNQYSYSNNLITLLKPDSCYLIKGKNSTVRTLSLTPETGTPTNPQQPYRLYAQAGCALDTLFVPAGAACIIQGDSLRSKSCQVRGGTLTMEVPVVLEMPGKSSGVTGDWEISSLYIDGGTVTVNDTLRTYAKGNGYGIYSQSSSKLTIGSKGVVYAYGSYWGCSLFSDTPAEIKDGGILRAAGSAALAAGDGSLSFPAIEWGFFHTPDSDRLTLKTDGGNPVVATFSEKVFGPYFNDATQFAANVESNTTYHLYAGENTTPFNGRAFKGTQSATIFTDEFTAPESSGLQSYSYVGLPMETFISAPDSITLTSTCTYRLNKVDKDTHFDNVLSCTVNKLCITSRGANHVLLNGVTINDSLLVKEDALFYLLDNTVNTLGNVRVEKGGNLTLGIGGNGTLAATAFVNSGTFTDNIGLVDRVKASVTAGDTLLISRPSVSGTAEVTSGGTTTLTAVGVSEWQPRASNGVSPTYSYYWQEWKEGEGWITMSGKTNSSLTVGKGKYRCQVTYQLVVAGNSSIYAYTALYSLPVEVKEKSAPPYVPPVYSYYTVTLPEVEGARLDKTGSHTVEEGSSFPFRLTLDDGYDRSQPIVTIDRHGTETLTPEVLADGSLKYRIRDVEQDLTVSIAGIVRNDDPTAMGSVPAADVRVRSFGNLLHITVPAPTTARLYDFHGRLLRIALLPAGSSTVPKPAGPCIVVLGGESFKVGD